MSTSKGIFALSVLAVFSVAGFGAPQKTDRVAAFAGTWSGRYATEERRAFVLLTGTQLDPNRVRVRWVETPEGEGSPREIEATGVITPKGTLTFTADGVPYEVVVRGPERVMRFTGREVRLLTPGKICPDPREPQPCADAGGHNLPFMLPTDGVARPEFQSDPFYAIVLKTVPRCSVTDDQLGRMQTLFPANKVFATRAGCDDEEVITYTNVNADYGFVAVYAGAKLDQARKFLAVVDATKQFPGANLRKMQTVLVYP